MTETTDTVDETVEDVNEEAAEDAAEVEGGEDNSTEESDASTDDTTDKEEDNSDDDPDEEPPTRKPRTNADWVALRRQQKLEKQKAGKGEQGEDAGDDDSDDEDDDISDEDAKLIDKVVSKRLEPFEKKEQIAELRTEINEFVADNPDFKPFAEKALKWAQHPSWKDVPTKQLMYAAAGDKLMQMGAKRSKMAVDKANKTKTGSNSGGEAGGKKPVAEMTDEEFEQEVQRVKTEPKN